ncbi:OmpA family protein [Mesobacterium sp. TK19101]|uniref:OmpA family protein n=1 Tax=Mesobacterium hydrothermale TaxID=3111907 RepID=A0ABU6HFG0_9RHOB|nr:OmpA family protein [Mesobacterium sp. TK19101]MEC3859820.1 OmpA family protein [Mesobacterium sp. TK19101]
MTSITRWRADLCAALVAVLLAAPLWAADLTLPAGARLTLEDASDPDSYLVPLGVWADGRIPLRSVEGAITRQSWRIEGQGATTLQVMMPLRSQLLAQGYEVLFECAAQACGGFDFRFGTEVLPAPEMYVDLTNYRFLTAWGGDANRFVTLLVSRSSAATFLQIIRTAPSGSKPVATDVGNTPIRAVPQCDLARQLEEQGHIVLSDLAFTSGSSDLGEGSYGSLAALAEYLLANPSRRVALVGHTDAVGSLEANVALSRRRAASVEARLERAYGVPAAQLSADGVGFLAPLASNLTEAGRIANRRVEAVLISTE